MTDFNNIFIKDFNTINEVLIIITRKCLNYTIIETKNITIIKDLNTIIINLNIIITKHLNIFNINIHVFMRINIFRF